MGRGDQNKRLEALIKKHEELIPTVLKTQVKVDLYWKCYAYGDELKPHIEFLDGIMLSSTRDIAPSCIENVEELIERQEKSLSQMETKRSIVKDLIAKGKVLLENPDKPKFLDSHVGRIEEGWEETKDKATARLTLLNNTKAAWEGYGAGLDNVAVEFEKCEGEITKVKKRFNLQAAIEDLELRQKKFGSTKATIDGMYSKIQADYACMTQTLPEDKKDFAAEADLLPQGDKVPQDAQDYKDELKRIQDYVVDLHQKVMQTCDSFSEDVKFWAEYKTG